MSQHTNHHSRGAAQGKRLTFMSIAFAVIFISLAGSFRTSLRVHADDDRDEWKVRRGFEIAPVPLNLKGKDRYLVGLGSYIVNA
ncbi:MAG: hypothetical protein JOY85_14810, partial [Acidobacteriaceae bacterium]|nr:hypothetical protein [Acidobacteriaceae bacterium]